MSLNPQQQAAVATTDAPLLVLAGAGSGKTRVITQKIAHLIRSGLPARHIAAVTFTNKAAREMKSRVGKLVSGSDAHGLWVSTFHSLGLEIVRREHKALGYKAALSILDEEDRHSLLRELAREQQRQCDAAEIKAFARRIGQWKNAFVTPEAAPADDPAAGLYAEYARLAQSYHAVDFDDLLYLPVVLFERHPEVLEHWQNRLRYLLVDEYQDTNHTQYRLLQLLAGALGRFTVVGDDDQSIYAFRGAQMENLARLERDFPRLRVIKLEQNYRSTGRILKAANALIAHNPHLHEKKLWSALGFGDPIRVLRHDDEVHEAQQIVAELQYRRFQRGGRWSDYAVLYRSNHQARPLERALREAKLPYHLSGGLSFFARAEIKDILAYLRLLVNPDDDVAFLRVVNTPRREIGPKSLEKLAEYAERRHQSLFAACFELGLQQSLDERAASRLNRFGEWLVDTADRARRGDTFGVIREMIESMGYPDHLRDQADSGKQAERRLANVYELIEWLERLTADELKEASLDEVVAKAVLMDILDRNGDEEAGDRVSLMTLHAAKGLEFDHVYIVGMEEGILPHQSSIDLGDVEEERRLCYVGITRARQSLALSYCGARRRYGETVDCQPSRFLSELPTEDLEWTERQPVSAEVRQERGRAAFSLIRGLLEQE